MNTRGVEILLPFPRLLEIVQAIPTMRFVANHLKHRHQCRGQRFTEWITIERDGRG